MTFFQNKWLRHAAWVVAGVLGLWTVTWLAVPALVKYGVEKMGSDTLGRTVTLGRADFHPWTLVLTLDDLSVASAGADASAKDATPQVHIKRILLDAALWQSLRRLAPVVDAVSLDQPTIKATYLGDGHYDFDDVLAKLNTPSDKPAGAPPHFAVYNIAITGGAVDLTDQALKTTHTLRDLHLSLPFLSNLDSQRSVQTLPHLAFKLNGSSFDSAAQSTPFAPSRKTDAQIRLDHFDLAPYLAYLPASLPVQLQGAVLSADLQLAFEETPKLSVKLSGTVQADQLKIANPQGEKWLALDTLKVTLDELRPLEQSVKISEIALSAPVVDLRRDAAGNLQFTSPAKTTKTIATSAGKSSASGIKDTENDAGWKVSVAKLALQDGTLRWLDASTRPAAEVALHGVTVDASAITWPFTQPLAFTASAQVDGGGAASATPAELKLSGTTTDVEANVDAALGGLPLALAAPYLANTLEPRLSGQLGADLQVHWQAAGALQVTARQLTLDRLALGETGTDNTKTKDATKDKSKSKAAPSALFSLRQLQLSQAVVDVTAQRVQIGKLVLTEPRTKVERSTDGHWMFERWLKPPAAHAEAKSTPAAPASAPWAVSIADLALEGGALSFLDQSTYQPVAVDISALSVQMKDLVPGSAKASPLTISARIGAENSRNVEPGRLAYKGTLALQPLAAVGQVDLLHLPLHAFEPYFGASLNVDIVRADTSFKGQVAYTASPAGPVLKVKGDGTLEDFRANNGVAMVAIQAAAPTAPSSAPLGAAATAAAVADASSEQALLRWKLLNLRGLDVSVSPASPTTVDVKETALSDFYARLVLNENGRLNLQDLVKPSAAETASAANTVAVSAAASSASAPKDLKKEAEPGGAVVRFGGISLVNGRVLFTDHFIKPNYSANLSALTGRLGAFASVPVAGAVQMADLELRGRVGDSAVLEILGKLNPLAKPLALDIKSKVTDLELPGLSPYSVFYVGHGIERGKLSIDVHYVVLPNGQLTATNSIILNQLTFGEQVPGAPSSLPVKLAVALLADSNGVINLDLPLSGSLNDPQFRIGPVIFKILGNLITKAITAPFSLLAHAFGGGADALGTVNFPLGSAALTPEARSGLDKVAKALTERPTLKLTVVGSASLNAERDALQREKLRRRVEAEKRRNTVLQGTSLAAPKDEGDTGAEDALADPAVSDAEYATLLKAIYKRANFPKPRNALGLVKDLPVPEMEQLLLANMPADDDAIRQLAIQRGVAVRDYLATQQLPLDRLFLGASKTVDEGTGWKPQADLQLAMP
ncbi:DUF748 domain-containing protein [Rhodoferax sp.]|uniref:DUF748 domain-containing protein n=1 Tax=Rhodoferax sp. TaxID=50421 RepID=UPI0025E97D2B|nr:DUF748 domain-containing protein [Rhodoferax sp.]